MNTPSVDRLALQRIFEKYFQSQRPRLAEFLMPFYQTMANDLLIGFFFANKDLRAISSKQAEFLWRAAGLSHTYSGHAPATAHLGLAPILDGHFDRRLRLLESHLRHLGLDAEEIGIWVSLENAFRGSIVGH